MALPLLPLDWRDRLEGTLLGTAVGDALGLPREGLSRRRALRLFGTAPLRHRFVFGRGMLSDDTEHACMTAQALLASNGDPSRFARSLALRLRGWLLALPAAVGWGTLRAIVKLWLGFSPARSGVFSAGNGPAMRAPLLGVCLSGNPEGIESFVHASTRITHRDPKAEDGAIAVAIAAAHACRRDPNHIDCIGLLGEIHRRISNDELKRSLDRVVDCLERDASASHFAAMMGLERGVTGYMLHTVPAALFCWLSSPGDFRRAVETIILLGGDTDTTGAIVGGLAGAANGARTIPNEWLEGIADWPRSVEWMRQLAERLAGAFGDEEISEHIPRMEGPVRLFWPALPARNVVFLALALVHGFRRLLPPY